MKKDKSYTPFSKRLLEYSRAECWIMTVVLFIMQGVGLNTGELYQIVLAGWAAYGIAKGLYYNMAKSDHQIQLLQSIDKDANETIKETIVDNIKSDLSESVSENIQS